MGKVAGRVLLALLAAGAGSAQIQHDVAVVNIAVPVRVFDGGRFVDSLGLGDFEVREDGRVQPVEAVYLVRGGAVKRQEGAPGAPAPETRRNFVLLFQIAEYMPEIDKAVDLFFESVCRPGDAVDIVTPQRTLRLRDRLDTPAKVKKAQYEIKNKLRTDVLVLQGAYRSIVDDMLAHLGSGDPEYAQTDLNSYRNDLQRFEALRAIDPDMMTAFAAELKGRPGAKHVFIFYQRDKVPRWDSRRIAQALTGNSYDDAFKVQELMAIDNGGADIERKAIQQAFSDAATDIHFLYITRNRRDPQLDVENVAVLDGIQMAESSAEIYRVFKEIAAATGGTSAASANPAALLRDAAEASESYYLLYYRPQEYRADGAFHGIEVAVKRSGLRVSHREGYFAGGGSEAPGDIAADLAAAARAGDRPRERVEDIDLAEPLPAKGDPVPESVLEAAAAYCRGLEEASLDFVCREEVRERLAGVLFRGRMSVVGPARDDSTNLVAVEDKARAWVYDYQLVRKGGWAAETRTLLEENGRAKREPNASLATVRFTHKFVVLGPVGLFSEAAQERHEYRVTKETEADGEPALVIDVRPKGADGAALYGQAWVRPRDGAVLKVEWEPASMGNYEAIQELAKAVRAKPQITFTSEYGVEKNGLRFPSSYEVVEAYRTTRGMVTASRTSVGYKDYKFFEVKVQTKLRHGG